MMMTVIRMIATISHSHNYDSIIMITNNILVIIIMMIISLSL